MSGKIFPFVCVQLSFYGVHVLHYLIILYCGCWFSNYCHPK